MAHRLLAHNKALTLALEVPPQPVTGNLGADLFGRVVHNLVSNALKFTPAMRRVTMGLHAHASQVRLRLQDAGICIPEALQGGLFEKLSASSHSAWAGRPAET